MGGYGLYLLKSLSPHKFYLVISRPDILTELPELGGIFGFNGNSHDRACIIVKDYPSIMWDGENESKLLLKRWDVQGPKKYIVLQKIKVVLT